MNICCIFCELRIEFYHIVVLYHANRIINFFYIVGVIIIIECSPWNKVSDLFLSHNRRFLSYTLAKSWEAQSVC
jgi:hypothetical protein